MLARVCCFILILGALVLFFEPLPGIQSSGSHVLASAQQKSSSVYQSSATEKMTNDCSLICVCSCRQTPSSQGFAPLRLRSNVVTFETAEAAGFEYVSPYTASFSRSIWQPPKA